MESRQNHIKQLQQNVDCIRNICIIAHVDHGKTSLSDCLLASNGIISSKLAGKVRYLDSREDEQERGITMESSGISLFFNLVQQTLDSNNERKLETKEYLINLIDSPGHVDFSSEVSTASRLCDGALLLVDAVEGVCAQTHTVLRQAKQEKVKPILVLNKIDRLITELKHTPHEAYVHLSHILEQVNAILGTFEAGDLLQEAELDSEKEIVENPDDEFYFAPEKGNVIFASAVDGWAFRTIQFSKMYASKLGVKENNLNRFMWGNYYLDPKTKRVIGPKALKGRPLKPMFVQFALDNIWKVYEVVYNNDRVALEKIIQSLGIKVPPRDMKSKDLKILCQSVMSQWLPLSNAVLLAVVQKVPNPLAAQAYRMNDILLPKDSDSEEKKLVNQAIVNCDASETAPVVAYISKMFTISSKDLPVASTKKQRYTPEELRQMRQAAIARSKLERNQEEDAFSEYSTDTAQPADTELLVGFARIYSGVIKVGQKLHILGPKYDIDDPERYQYVAEMEVERLFLLMGKDLQDLESVSAGNVFGILGCNEKVLKTATLTSDLNCCSLAGFKLENPPILRVALEPENPTQMNQLIEGLELLNRSDPCVQVELQDTGENVIVCAGELHLEDLRERFAKIEIQVSKPIVPFRETLSFNPSITFDGSKPESQVGIVNKATSDKSISLTVRVIPLPNKVRQFLLSNTHISNLAQSEAALESAQEFMGGLKGAMAESIKDKEYGNIDIDWESLLDNLISVGHKNGSNLLINQIPNKKTKIWLQEFESSESGEQLDFMASILSGFQLATTTGPLCNEPVAGIAVLLQEYEVNTADSKSIPGQVLSFTKDAVRQGFLQWSPRLMLAQYTCELQTEALYMGKVDGVLSRRKGKIISEDIKEGTPLFTIKASLPVVESFGFVDELRKKTSGVASPQLVFTGFEVLDMDPYWVPKTEEELEDMGDKADKDNLAKKYMEDVRVRKATATIEAYTNTEHYIQPTKPVYKMNGGDTSGMRDANGNIGIGNQGSNNIGNYNIGNNNVGDRNNGNNNVGSFNNGNNNHGSFNNGNDNWGNNNVGNHITGNSVIQTAVPASNAIPTVDTSQTLTQPASIETSASNSLTVSGTISTAALGSNTVTPTPTTSSDNSLSAGLLAAIIIPIVLVILLLAACCFWYSKRRTEEAGGAGGAGLVKRDSRYSPQILVSEIPPAVSLPSANEQGLGTAIASEYQSLEYGTAGAAVGAGLAVNKNQANEASFYNSQATIETDVAAEAPRYQIAAGEVGISASTAAAFSEQDEKVVAYNTDTLSSHHSGAAKKVEYEEYTLPRIPSQAASLAQSSPLVYDQELNEKISVESVRNQGPPPAVQLESGLAGATVFTGLAALAAAVGITSSGKKQEESAVISEIDTESFADSKIGTFVQGKEESKVNVLKKVNETEKVEVIETEKVENLEIDTVSKHNTLEEAALVEGFAQAVHNEKVQRKVSFEEVEHKVIKEEIVIKKIKEVKFEEKKVEEKELNIPAVNTDEIKAQLSTVEEGSTTAVAVDKLPEKIQIQKQTYTRKDDKYFVPDDDEPEDLDDWAPPAATSHVVFTSYFPRQRDEMLLQPGDLIGIEKEYGDGWARGQNISQGRKRCIFPLAILTPIKSGPSQNVRKGKGMMWQGQTSTNTEVKENVVYEERSISLRRLRGKNRSRTITLALNGKRKADRAKGAIYFCFPTKNFLTVFNNDFGEDPLYKEALFISPIKTPNEIVSSIRKSPCRRFVLSWVDGRYDFNVMIRLKQIPNIKYFDPNGAGTNLAARAAWKVYQKAEELEEAKEEWPVDNNIADLLIIDRSADTLTPILHNLYYQAIIQDLFYVENGKKLHLPTDEIRDEKVYELSDKDQYFMKLRHLYLGDVGEEIAKFIAENPAANEYYNGGTAEIGDKVYSLLDAQKIQQHSVIFDALCKAYQENRLDTLVEIEQVDTSLTQNIATGASTKTGSKITNEIVDEVSEESVRDIALDGFSGLDVLRSGKTIPTDDSDPMWKYTFEGWKVSMQAKGKAVTPENEEIITRFKPTLHHLLDDYLNNWFAPVFSSVEEEIIEEEEVLERGNGLVVPFTKGFTPSWGRMKPENPDVEEYVDLLKNGRRVIVFVLGGMAISEVQTIHNAISMYSRDILIGSTNLITPNMFANDICKLGENDSGMPRLLPPIKPLLQQELDLRNKKKLKLLAEQERLKREEEDAIEEEKQKELQRLQSQMQRVNIKEGRQRLLQEALAEADEGLDRNESNAFSNFQPMPRSMSPSNVSLDRGPGYASLQKAANPDTFNNVSYASQKSYFAPPQIHPPPPFSDKYQPTQYSSLSYFNGIPEPQSQSSTPSTNSAIVTPNIQSVKTNLPIVTQSLADEQSVTSTVFTKVDEKIPTPALEVKNPLSDQISRTTSVKSLDSISCPSESARRENSTSSGERKVDVKKLFQRPTVIRKKSDKLTKMALKYRELAANSTRSESNVQFENFIPPTPTVPQSENAVNQRFPQRRVVPASATRVPNSGRNISHDSYSDGNSPYSQNSPNSTHSSHPNLPYNQPQTSGYSEYNYSPNIPSPPPVRRQVYAPPQGPNWTQAALAQGGPPQLIQRQSRPPVTSNYPGYYSPNRPEPPSPQQYQGIPPQQYQSPQQYQPPPANQYRNSQNFGFDSRNSQYDNRANNYSNQYDNRSSGYDRQDNRTSQYDMRPGYERQQSSFYGNQAYNQYQEQYRPQHENFNRQSPGPDQYRFQGYSQPPEGIRPQESQGFVPPVRGPYRPGQYQPRPPI
ncbi:Cytoplasmic GTPase/eEF2-like protein (ribosomal biogenesis) [Boothiomyces sp. JEL0866]|nr:Cytoplasmic GTPase/eEF2-like protein (ribosomal biogenesis) [Boothiomyces sp. JEL0866]